MDAPWRPETLMLELLRLKGRCISRGLETVLLESLGTDARGDCMEVLIALPPTVAPAFSPDRCITLPDRAVSP